MTAALLLLIPCTALLGACVHLPRTAGIDVITTTMYFQGTWIITNPICWEWHRIAPVLASERVNSPECAAVPRARVMNGG